jgi:hypothetical protein
MGPMLTRLIGEKVNLAIVGPRGTGCVMVDPGQIEQAIVNLAVSGREAMPDGDTLTIEVAEVEAAPTHTSSQAGPVVTLSVTDTGARMDAERMRHIFEPSTGRGLVVPMVLGIVRQAGGDMTVIGEPGHGTTFTISLPSVAKTTSDESSMTGTILILEDDPGVRRFVSHVLQAKGYRVLTAGDGDSAIQLLKREPVQLWITDTVHPGPAGSELASKVAAPQPGTPLLLMSGGTKEEWVRAGWLGPDGHFLSKPFTSEALGRLWTGP